MKDLMPDVEMALAYLRWLTGQKSPVVTFQTFDDQGEDKSKARILHGKLSQHLGTLITLNNAGAGIFVTVNETDLKGRTLEHMVALRALYVDEDQGSLLPNDIRLFFTPPTCVVQSKNGHHYYWKLQEGEDLAKGGPALECLIEALGTDPKPKDITRVLRLPGFFHMKNPAEPFQIKLLSTTPDTYTIDEITQAYGNRVVQRKPRVLVQNGLKADFKFSQGEQYERKERARNAARKLGPSIPGNGGDEHHFKVACTVVRSVVTVEDARSVLDRWNETCEPPWPEHRMEHKLNEALKLCKLGEWPLAGR